MKCSSIGSFCQSSQLLIRQGLKTESYPFDWIYSNFDVVKHCIEDDFKTFLDRSQYFYVPPTPRDPKLAGHSLYSTFIEYKYETVPQGFFLHHDPRLDDKDYEYFERCVERFKDLIKSDDKKLFTYVYKNREPERSEEAFQEALSFIEFFNKHVNNYFLIFVYHSIGPLGHSLTKKDNLFFIKMSAAHSNGMSFDDGSHDVYLDGVLKQIINEIK